ncbi:hypothetical protein BDN72DRAFT_740444, partial [Pluteus cervinus]
LPRRDQEEQRDKYLRTMLILFSPWRDMCDLIDLPLTDKFEYMKSHSDLYHLKVIENMQVLHECRDSRD